MSLQNYIANYNQSSINLPKRPSLKAKACAEMAFCKFRLRTISTSKLIIEMTQKLGCHDEVTQSIKGFLLKGQLAARMHFQSKRIVLWRIPKASVQQQLLGKRLKCAARLRIIRWYPCEVKICASLDCRVSKIRSQ